MGAAKVQASLRIHTVSPEPLLLAHTSNESSGTFRQKARSLAPLNNWACAVKICLDGMLEDTNSLYGAHFACNSFDINCCSGMLKFGAWWSRLRVPPKLSINHSQTPGYMSPVKRICLRAFCPDKF